MAEFEIKSVCILGRQPALGLAELESSYGAEHVQPGPQNSALLSVDGSTINFQKLGGTIKVGRLLATIPSNSWADCISYLREMIPGQLKNTEEGKFTLGISTYGFEIGALEMTRDLLGLKKVIKNSGRSVRLVPNKLPALSSAQVLHNKLTRRGSWELLLIKNGPETLLAQTLFVQDIEAYAARDQARPARDARVGMLPPKLAQIILNIAKPPASSTVLDPFCGSGVILQEALLMGYKVIGTDIDERMVEFSQKNLAWLAQSHDLGTNSYALGTADATSHQWDSEFDSLASELYLGRPLNSLPEAAKLREIVSDVNTITRKFLENIRSQLKPGTRFCLAVPAWIDGPRVTHLPLIDQLTDMGYNRYDFVHVKNSGLLYYREGQTVARELLVLTKLR